MPITLQFLDNGQGTVFLCKGIVTGEEIIQSNKAFLSAPDNLKNSRYSIIDYSQADRTEISTADVKHIAAQDKKIAEVIPDYIVAVVAGKELAYGISRMWETIIELNGLQWETKVFRDRPAAETWIRKKANEKYQAHFSLS